MLVKDLMEEKQLNFNQPLLSVRRFSLKVASETNHRRNTNDNSLATFPSYKSELSSGPVRSAGNIPFVWEKTPGKPKDIAKTKLQSQSVKTAEQQDSDIVVRTGSNVSNSEIVATLDEKVTKYKGLKEGIEEKESCDSDDDETFLDALDTLSRTESFFMSCNLSGLNGWDDSEFEGEQAGSFSSDARDFMIDRFLPAAKAMISETPQYASKKALIGQQKQLQKVVSTERSPTLNQHKLKSLWHYIQDIGREKIEDEIDDSENFTTTACGLFPRLCLLNPIPGVTIVDKVQSNAGFGMQAKLTTKENAKPLYHEKNTICESPVVEKTLYVDSVHKVKSQTNQKEDNSSHYKNLSVDSSQENSQRMDVINVKAALQAKISKSLEMTNDSMRMVSEKLDNQGSDLDQDMFTVSSTKMVDSESRVSSNVKNSDMKGIDQKCNLASSKVEEDGKIDLESQCVMKLGHEELYDATSYFEIPLVLPTLKAPSESWLKKTLPTISSRNISSRPNLGAKVAPLSPKWETIVKSSNEELLKPIAEE